MQTSETPFACHVFVCVNDRKGARKSCADDGQAIKDHIKAKLKTLKLPAGAVRVTQSGCLGICETGPNVMLYPQEKLFTHVSFDDVDAIVDEVVRIVNA